MATPPDPRVNELLHQLGDRGAPRGAGFVYKSALTQSRETPAPVVGFPLEPLTPSLRAARRRVLAVAAVMLLCFGVGGGFWRASRDTAANVATVAGVQGGQGTVAAPPGTEPPSGTVPYVGCRLIDDCVMPDDPRTITMTAPPPGIGAVDKLVMGLPTVSRTVGQLYEAGVSDIPIPAGLMAAAKIEVRLDIYPEPRRAPILDPSGSEEVRIGNRTFSYTSTMITGGGVSIPMTYVSGLLNDHVLLFVAAGGVPPDQVMAAVRSIVVT